MYRPPDTQENPKQQAMPLMRGWFFLLHTGNCFNVLLYSGCLPCSALTSDTEHAHQKIYIHCDCVSFSSVLLLLLAIQIGFHLLSILGHPPLNHQQPATTTGNKKPSQQYNRRRHCRVPLKRNKNYIEGVFLLRPFHFHSICLYLSLLWPPLLEFR